MRCRKTLYLWFVCLSQFVKFLHLSKNPSIQFGQFLHYIGKQNATACTQKPEVTKRSIMRDCSKSLVNNLKITDKAIKRQLFLMEIGPFTSVKTSRCLQQSQSSHKHTCNTDEKDYLLSPKHKHKGMKPKHVCAVTHTTRTMESPSMQNTRQKTHESHGFLTFDHFHLPVSALAM